MLSTVLGLAGGLAARLYGLPSVLHAVVGWNVAATTMLLLSWNIIFRADANETKRRARSQDPGRFTVWMIALASSVFSLFAAISVLGQARAFAPDERTLGSVLSVAGIVLAWGLTHTAYSLRYAHLYYRGKLASGLIFPGDHPPCDLDFAYFSFTLGMCFQTSDIAVSETRIRRAVLLHSLVSFVYNTTILALSLNLLFGLMQP